MSGLYIGGAKPLTQRLHAKLGEFAGKFWIVGGLDHFWCNFSSYVVINSDNYHHYMSCKL